MVVKSMRNASCGLTTPDLRISIQTRLRLMLYQQRLCPSHHHDVRTVRPNLAVLLGVLRRPTPPRMQDKASVCQRQNAQSARRDETETLSTLMQYYYCCCCCDCDCDSPSAIAARTPRPVQALALGRQSSTLASPALQYRWSTSGGRTRNRKAA